MNTTEEQFQATIQALFEEKKKVKELQKKTRNLGKERNELQEQLSDSQIPIETARSLVEQVQSKNSHLVTHNKLQTLRLLNLKGGETRKLYK